MKVAEFKGVIRETLKTKIGEITSLYGPRGIALAPMLERTVENLERRYSKEINDALNLMEIAITDEKGDIDIDMLGKCIDGYLKEDIPFSFMGVEGVINSQSLRVELPSNAFTRAIIGEKNVLVFTPEDLKEITELIKRK